MTAKQSAASEDSSTPVVAQVAVNNASSVGRIERSAQERKPGRLGITVSKKVGNAVARNRVKRAVREFARGAGQCNNLRDGKTPGPVDGKAHGTWVPANMDVVVIAKKAAADVSTQMLWATLESCRSQLEQESGRC